MNLLLSHDKPRLKIIKLHGDLFYRQMAWTAAEMDDYLEGIWPQLSAAVAGRDFLTVGYSLKDARIMDLVLGTGGKVWFTNYSEYPTHLSAAHRERLDEVVSTDCAFESLFTMLASELGVVPAQVAAAAPEPPEAIKAPKPLRPGAKPKAVATSPAAKKTPLPTASTVDDLIASLVGIWNPNLGLIGMTGFVLAEPRVIVVDGCMSDPKNSGYKINEIVTSHGQHLRTRRLRRIPGDLFGPLLLKVPRELKYLACGWTSHQSAQGYLCKSVWR